jgi:hypothetical protein
MARGREGERSTAAALDSMDGLPASVTSILLGSPVAPPHLLLKSRITCCSPQVSCVSDAPDQGSDDEVPIPRLLTVLMKFPLPGSFNTPLYFHVMVVMMRFLPGVSCTSSSPYPPIVCPQPALQAIGRN